MKAVCYYTPKWGWLACNTETQNVMGSDFTYFREQKDVFRRIYAPLIDIIDVGDNIYSRWGVFLGKVDTIYPDKIYNTTGKFFYWNDIRKFREGLPVEGEMKFIEQVKLKSDNKLYDLESIEGSFDKWIMRGVSGAYRQLVQVDDDELIPTERELKQKGFVRCVSTDPSEEMKGDDIQLGELYRIHAIEDGYLRLKGKKYRQNPDNFEVVWGRLIFELNKTIMSDNLIIKAENSI